LSFIDCKEFAVAHNKLLEKALMKASVLLTRDHYNKKWLTFNTFTLNMPQLFFLIFQWNLNRTQRSYSSCICLCSLL